MRILNYLRPEGIEPDFEASTKEEVLRKLADKAVSIAEGVDAGEIFDVLQEREGLGSTGIGHGVAIPHGRIPGLKRLIVLVARCRQGVPFDSMDSRAVHVVVLLLAPDDATTAYLRVLARVSRVLKIKGVMDKIKNAVDAAEIMQVIGEAENHL